jgi:hypothetical protein
MESARAGEGEENERVVDLTSESEAALVRLYKRARRAQDDYTQERVDRALDEIIRADKQGLPEHRVSSALSNASNAIREQREVIATERLEDLAEDVPVPGSEYDVIDLMDWVHRSRGISHHHRDLLRLLADGWDADGMADLYGVSARRMRGEIIRARKCALVAYQQEVIDI